MKKILISADPYETWVAIVEDNTVVETYLERATRRSLLGNVYLGRVDNVLPGMEAAFIDAGLPKNCFLYVDEIVLPELDDRERRKKKIEQLIKNGQSLLVQVVKDPMGTKGARVTMDVSLAGFPDSHLTDYDKAVDTPLTVLGWTELALGLVFLALAFWPMGHRARGFGWLAALVLFILAALAVQFAVPWYFGIHLGLDNGIGG